jgi:predicted helicase
VPPLANLLQQLDPRPDMRGCQFERLCKWFLQSAPEYRRKFRRVSLWSEWPDAWAPDAGIDLVAEEHEGGLWEIQAKAYAPGYSMKKADVDCFLRRSGSPGT